MPHSACTSLAVVIVAIVCLRFDNLSRSGSTAHANNERRRSDM
eukprot:COSAG06_NODE_50754_length_316_cov_1.156682_1_plen_42_part_01